MGSKQQAGCFGEKLLSPQSQQQSSLEREWEWLPNIGLPEEKKKRLIEVSHGTRDTRKTVRTRAQAGNVEAITNARHTLKSWLETRRRIGVRGIQSVETSPVHT